MDIEQYLQEKRKLIDEALDKFLPADNQLPIIYESMRYSVFAGGKRLRPVLFLATAELFREDLEGILPVACAIELIHTYSLIHDDLPAMDDDDLRRGMPTNHKVYGEGFAILTGDALLTYAFELIA
ncbi:MAG: polyprenyl synthetase family protein, partial [Dethiobacteria bacterium]